MSVHPGSKADADAATPKRAPVKSWRESAMYLPPIMRDFHDQKDLFKAMDEVLQRYNAKGANYSRVDLSWIDAHKYTIDVFLWVMAGHGYTLQRSRAPLDFADLGDFVSESRKRRDAEAASILFGRRLNRGEPPEQALRPK